MSDTDEQTTVGRMLYYARRAGFLQGALEVIALGSAGDDPRLAAQRALDAVDEDRFVNGTPPTHHTQGTGSKQKMLVSDKLPRKLRNN